MTPPPAAATLESVEDTHALTFPDPLSLEGIASRRAKYPRLRAGVAAPSDVESFKGRGQHAHKSSAKRWDRE